MPNQVFLELVKSLSAITHYSEINENVKAYKLGAHKHIPEIEQILAGVGGSQQAVTFSTQLVPMTRGILATIYADLKTDLSEAELLESYENYYHSHPFVRIRSQGEWPATKEVATSNFCDIGLHVDKRTKQADYRIGYRQLGKRSGRPSHPKYEYHARLGADCRIVDAAGLSIKEKNKMIKTEQAMCPLLKTAITSPNGFQAGGVSIGLRKHNKLDMGWVYSEVPAAAAGVYPLNSFRAAPLLVTEESIQQEGKLQAIVVNSANANACTGEEGLANAYAMRKAFSDQLGIQLQHAAVASTGLIGVQLPMDKIMSGIHSISEKAKLEDFAQAILTTDTCTKQLAVSIEIDGVPITIGGAAKGYWHDSPEYGHYASLCYNGRSFPLMCWRISCGRRRINLTI